MLKKINQYKNDYLLFLKEPFFIPEPSDFEIKNGINTNIWGSKNRKYHSLEDSKLDMTTDIPQPSTKLIRKKVRAIEDMNENSNGEGLVEDFVLYIALKENKNDFFNMIELGAAFGSNIINAFLGNKKICNNTEFYGIAIEGSYHHTQMLNRHVKDNGAKNNIKTIHGAIHTSKDEQIFNDYIDLESSRRHFGQNVGKGIDNNYKTIMAEPKKVPTYTLDELLSEREFWNFLHLDIQGTELDLLKVNKKKLDEKVHFIFIGTHGSNIEKGLLNLFKDWELVFYYKLQSKNETIFGKFSFGDGIMFVVNPKFSL